MGLLGKLFGRKKFKTTDPDFGAIESFSTRGDDVGWQVNRRFMEADIEILIAGSVDGIAPHLKETLLQALNNEAVLKTESEQALRAQYENAELDFVTLDQHFELKGLSVYDDGFELSFQEKEGQRYFFNVHFEGMQSVGVSIDG